MSNQFPNLFSPIKVGKHVYKNRIIGAPIYCGTFSIMPPLAPIFYQAFKERARGGYAQVTIGETPVDFEYANREPFPPIDYTNMNDPAFEALRKVVDDIKQNGAKALIELSHCGESKLFIPGLKNPIGPTGYLREDGVEVIEMDESMMQSVCDNFVTCAKFMKAVGFDGVMIHAGHGWLLHQFLSSRTNLREDEYGGSLENRAKFPIKVIKGVREALGEDFIIEVRVSGDECIEGGMEIDETAEFCKMIEDYIDIIHVSIGLYRNPILSGQFSSSFHPYGLNSELSAKIKEAVSIPVTVVGGITSPELAERLIAEGKCDFVALARPLTADPQFGNKAKERNEDDIAQCIRCFKCFPGPLEDNMDDLSSIFGCTVNPQAFYLDEEVLNSKPKASKNVLVVGGGIAGMMAAIVAADRGHKVNLVEKSDTLGGLLKFTDVDYYKKDLGKFKDLLIRRVHKRDINVILGKEFTPDDINVYKPDAVIIAIGSKPVVPSIDGIENAMKALDVYDNQDDVGSNVIVVGGGLVGCELGLHLAKNDRNVTIVEMQDEVAPDAYPMHRIALLNEMDKMLCYKTGLKCTSIKSNGVEVEDTQGNKKFMFADTVVYALGMSANREEASKLSSIIKNIPVYEVGDCLQARKVYDAVREAFVAAMSIL